jgi:hypothetical protein
MNVRKISREHNFDALIAVEVARICAATKTPHTSHSLIKARVKTTENTGLYEKPRNK